ncbi:hypothetical protein DESC_920023 [Desulfosarcina cetonica]|nr:hypothetical protein DESC_920023 [Desulfosarcina cetonica]
MPTGTSEEIEQPFVDIVEAAIGHDQNNVTGFGGALEVRQDGLRIVEMKGIPPPGLEVGDQLQAGKTLPFGDFLQHRGFTDQDPVGGIENRGIVLLEDLAHARVGARLENGHKTIVREMRFYRLDRFADGRGMVGEIVHHGDAVFFAPDLLAPFDAGKPFQCTGDLVRGHAQVMGHGHGGKGVF